MTNDVADNEKALYEFISKTHLGICVKDLTSETLYRNAFLVNPPQEGQAEGCDELFLQLCHTQNWDQLRDGLHLFKFQHINSEFYDVLVLKSADHFAIFTYPLRGRNLCSPHYIETKSLTEKERLVISLMMAKRSNQEIASELAISINTLKTHIKNIYKKLSPEARKTLRRLRTGSGEAAQLEPSE